MKNSGLGKGLGALLPDINKQKFSVNQEENSTNKEFERIKISDIVKNPYQPRITFDRNALDDLKNSIAQHGVIQPITVRKVAAGYELISGERRLRASKELSLKDIPAYILDVTSNEQMIEISLIENLQRDDLNPMETAFGFKRLIDEIGLTQEQVALKVGKNRSTITNFLRLLKLPSIVQKSLEEGQISTGHARALLSLEVPEKIEIAFQKVVADNLSVRETEELVKNFDKNILKKSAKKEELIVTSEIKEFEEKLRHHFSSEVKIKTKNNKSGKIELDFYSEDDFERIMELIFGE